MILLDTHAAVWFSLAEGLGRQSQILARKALAEDRLAISAISFWEVALLISDSPAQLRKSLLDGGVIELPLTGDIALRSVDLGNFPSDPADRFIMATALIHNAVLLTADEQLLGWRHSVKRQNASK